MQNRDRYAEYADKANYVAWVGGPDASHTEFDGIDSDMVFYDGPEPENAVRSLSVYPADGSGTCFWFATKSDQEQFVNTVDAWIADNNAATVKTFFVDPADAHNAVMADKLQHMRDMIKWNAMMNPPMTEASFAAARPEEYSTIQQWIAFLGRPAAEELVKRFHPPYS